MGLHRDGGKWNLPDEVVEDRRRVFWEAHAAEVFQVCPLLSCSDQYEHTANKAGQLLLSTVSRRSLDLDVEGD